MLKKRIIPCLDIKDDRTVKGINFINLKDAGDPVGLAKLYTLQGADELVFLDITATIEKRKTFAALVEKVAQEINIPFTVGGGIQTLDDVSVLINSGADKVSVNSSAIRRPVFISEAARKFGSQCVTVAIDVKMQNNEWMVFLNGGRIATTMTGINWAKQAEQLGAGEILLTSMNNDGTKKGFAIDITNAISKAVNIPVIASGGAGKNSHFKELFHNTNASAALAASIFHFGEVFIPELKHYLQTQNIETR